jgi:hypothetical protein
VLELSSDETQHVLSTTEQAFAGGIVYSCLDRNWSIGEYQSWMRWKTYLGLVEAFESILLAVATFLMGFEKGRVDKLQVREHATVVVNLVLLTGQE